MVRIYKFLLSLLAVPILLLGLCVIGICICLMPLWVLINPDVLRFNR